MSTGLGESFDPLGARMQARIALEVLVERLPRLRLEEGHTVRLRPSINVRGIDSLPLRR